MFVRLFAFNAVHDYQAARKLSILPGRDKLDIGRIVSKPIELGQSIGKKEEKWKGSDGNQRPFFFAYFISLFVCSVELKTKMMRK